jgi:hypothetical protein
MSRIWQERKRANERIVRDYAARSPVMRLLGVMDFGSEWQSIVAYDTKTLVDDCDGTIRREGPVVICVRFDERFLSEAPHPMQIVSVFEPKGIFHPNCSRVGAFCLGHPAPGISMELILHQVWAGLMFNMKTVNTRPGQIVNGAAAVYVRANAHQFPISRRGLFEAPDEDLRNNHWHALFNPGIHSVNVEQLITLASGANE